MKHTLVAPVASIPIFLIVLSWHNEINEYGIGNAVEKKVSKNKSGTGRFGRNTTSHRQLWMLADLNVFLPIADSRLKYLCIYFRCHHSFFAFWALIFHSLLFACVIFWIFCNLASSQKRKKRFETIAFGITVKDSQVWWTWEQISTNLIERIGRNAKKPP